MAKERYEGLLGGLYRRNETFIMLSAMMFIASVFIGYAFADLLDPFLRSVLGDFSKRVVSGELQLNTVSLFVNNIIVALKIYAGGIVVGIGTAWFLLSNALFLGYAGAHYPDIGDFIIAIIPHGVFEVLGLIIAGAAGFRIGNVVINILKGILKLQPDFSMTNQFKFLLEANYDDFKDTLIMMGIALVLLLIAAIIEANFTPGWIQYMQGVA